MAQISPAAVTSAQLSQDAAYRMGGSAMVLTFVTVAGADGAFYADINAGYAL